MTERRAKTALCVTLLVAIDGSEVVAGTPAEFDRHLSAELDRFGRIIREVGIGAQ